MRVLVIDTALDACTAAVFAEGRAVAERTEPMARGHQERIGVLVRDVVEQAGGFEALDRVGVTVGPGSFTGLRVGLSFAQGLGAALGRPVVGISTLQALAASVPNVSGSDASGPDVSGAIAAVIDARRGQVYLQTFIDGVAEGEAAPWDIEAARLHLNTAGRNWRLIGSGAALVAPEGAVILTPTVPTGEALATLTVGADPQTAPPRPLYLRAPDATPPTRLPGQARERPARP